MTVKHSKGEMISLRLSARILERLRKAAHKDGQQVSEFVRLAIIRQVERREASNGS
jgi:hypothetical protein